MDNKDENDKQAASTESTDQQAKPTPQESGARGGKARAQNQPKEVLSKIGAKGAAARWGEKPTRALHKGNFKEEFGIDVDCYVLDDDQHTAVISQRGMGETLGLGKGGSRLPVFIGRKDIAPYLGRELTERLANPLVFKGLSMGVNMPPPRPVNGYDVTILIDICNAIIEADKDGKLAKSQKIVRQAQIIVGASAKAGIKNLVWALAGYDATRQEVITAFKLYVIEEARDYEKEFPAELYEEWYRLYQLPKMAKGRRPWKFKSLTVSQVYKPLARSNGKILELTRAMRADSDDRHAKLHQFLSLIGVKALRRHLGRLLGMAEMSKNVKQYEDGFQRVFGEQLDLNI